MSTQPTPRPAPVYISDANAATYGIPDGDAGKQLVQDAQQIYDIVHNAGLATMDAISTATAAWGDPDRVNAAIALLQRMSRLVGPL